MKWSFFQSKNLMRLVLFLGLLGGLHGLVMAKSQMPASLKNPIGVSSDIIALAQKITDDEKHVFMAQEELDKLQEEDEIIQSQGVESSVVSERDLAKLRLSAELANVAVENQVLELGAVNQSIATVQAQVSDLTKEIASLRAAKRDVADEAKYQEIEKAIAEKRGILTLMQKREPLLRELLSISEEIAVIYDQRLMVAQRILVTRQTENRESRQAQLQAQLVAQQQEYQTMAAKIRDKLQMLPPGEQEVTRLELQDQLFDAQERAALIEVKLANAQASLRITNLAPIPQEGFYSPAKAREVENSIQSLLDTLVDLNHRITNKVALLQRLKSVSQQRDLLGLISKTQSASQQETYDALLNSYQSESALDNELTAHLLSYRAQFQKAQAQGISVLQKFPTSLSEWKQLAVELQAIPQLLFTEIRYLVVATTMQFKTAHPLRLFILFLCELIWLVGCYHAGSMLKKLINDEKQNARLHNFSRYAWQILVQLMVRNGKTLTILGAVFLLLRILDVPSEDVNLAILLVLVALLFKFMLDVARMVLLENSADHQGNDVKLYHNLRRGLLLAGLITLLTALAHSLPISADATGFVDRLFMLVLLVVSFPLLKSTELLSEVLIPYRDKHIYLYRAGRVVSFLAPLIIMSTAIIGLIGYVDLAWRIGMIEGQFLLVLFLWMVLRGMVGDAMDWLSERLISEVRNGWVWSEAFLKPIHSLINLVLLLGAIIALCVVYGQYSEVQVFTWIREILYRPIYIGETVSIAVINVLAFIIFSAVVVWLAKWSREFAYRWLYSNTPDPGLRNSLAVFTQYAAVSLGVIFILRLLGINLTTLAVVLGAVGFGVGIGLRDIFNNFVSGVLVLIERPVRTGDYVKIGDFEGEVIHIGMRAVTIKTGDNGDVLIPNSQMMGNSFTNWTYNDDIVRIVTPIRIAFEEDAHRAQQVILEVLRKNPDILRDPEPVVYIQELSEASILLSVKFFVNLKACEGLSGTRSTVLFAILDALHEEKIPLAVPQREIIMRQTPIYQS